MLSEIKLKNAAHEQRGISRREYASVGQKWRCKYSSD